MIILINKLASESARAQVVVHNPYNQIILSEKKNPYFSTNVVLFPELRGHLRICLTPSGGDLWGKLEWGGHEE